MDKDKEVIPKEVISPMEEKFESLRNRIGLFLGPLVFVIFYFLCYRSSSNHVHSGL